MQGFLLERLYPTGWRRSGELYWRLSDAERELQRAMQEDEARGVRVLAVHVDRRQIDLGLAEILETVRQSPRSQARHTRRPATRRRSVGGRGRDRRARH